MSRKPLTIGLVLDDGLDKPDGVQQYVIGLGEWMRGRGHDVHYLVGETTRGDINNVHSLAKNIKVNFNGNTLTIPLISFKAKIKALLKKYEFDVLHVQVPYSPLMGGRVIDCAQKKTKILGTFHVLPHGPVASAGSGLLGLVTRRQNKRFNGFFAVSRPAQEFAKSKFSIESTVIPNFVDSSVYKNSKKGSKDPVRIIFVNRLVERKGCKHLLRALRYAQENSLFNRKVEVDVCGKGPQFDKLRGFCRKHGLKDVNLRGFVPEEEKIKLLSKADMAVYPSLGGESFGIVLLEAMASGCLVVAGDNPGYRSVLDDAQDSLIDPKDTPGFARHLASVINDKSYRNELLQGQQKLIGKFDISSVGRQIERQYYAPKHDKLRRTKA